MFGLDAGFTALLILCLFLAFAFEFINGFHDTANAVATVIYTNTLKPMHAVILSGIMNALGVFVGGISVAVGIINLLPVETLVDQNIYHSIAMVVSLLLTAIIWNLGTWYFGIPCSSSHTLIGSILGVGIAYSFLPDATNTAVNWSKAGDIGLSLLLSPALGFSLTVFLMFLMRWLIKNETIFKSPETGKNPPAWIRGVLIATCSGVSFSHGSNDGQKGVGLVMLVLIGIVPAYFAINTHTDPLKIAGNVAAIEQVIDQIDTSKLSYADNVKVLEMRGEMASLNTISVSLDEKGQIQADSRFEARKNILIIGSVTKKLLAEESGLLTSEQEKTLKNEVKSLKNYTDYAPRWVIIMISLALGLGTMVGWKRIVITIGEKIGKTHLTYAQGASAEIVAASTIGFSTFLGLPVSTTHVLSSGIAGAMVASDGLKNLQRNTMKNILIAWLLTFPVCVLLSGGMFLLLRAIL